MQIWLYAQVHVRLEGVILGFDEFMNLVLDNAEEVEAAHKGRGPQRRSIGRILLKGDTIVAVTQAPGVAAAATAAAAAAAAAAPVAAGGDHAAGAPMQVA